jgi:hypothetical protein
MLIAPAEYQKRAFWAKLGKRGGSSHSKEIAETLSISTKDLQRGALTASL